MCLYCQYVLFGSISFHHSCCFIIISYKITYNSR
uniref:Uncharacterized protein n=1 Tax=Rhizophora mucronata TaxID=61149 RepID=A0A2P2QQ79_RHIMU